MKLKTLLAALLLLVTAPSFGIHDYPADSWWLEHDEQSTLSIDHSDWQHVLDQYVHASEDGINRVDYQSLQESPERLQSYLEAMSQVAIHQYSRAEQFAFWVNLYNAITLNLVAEHYPVSSIRRIYGGLFRTGPWDEELFTVNGISLTLNDIEHRILRPIWQDYRIHFVVNCASIGCPNLGKQALTAENQQAVLNAAAIEFLSHPRGVRIEGNRVILSKIFKWYATDFGHNSETLLRKVAEYVPSEEVSSKLSGVSKLRYEYDWSLNATLYPRNLVTQGD